MSWIKACRSLDDKHRRILSVFEPIAKRVNGSADRRGARPEVIGSGRLALLALAHARAVDRLFKADPTLWPAAAVVARCVLEAGMTATWIMRPDDSDQRGYRWCAHMVASYERFEAGNSHLPENAAKDWKAWRKQGEKIGVAFPNFKELLEELGEPTVYRLYVWACQYSHGSTWGIDTMVEERDPEADASRWCLVFRSSALGLAMSGATVFSRLGEPMKSLSSLETIYRGLERAWEAAEGLSGGDPLGA